MRDMNRPTKIPASTPTVDLGLRRFSAADDYELLPIAPTTPCPYLRGRDATHECFITDSLDPDLYHDLMDRGFRRSGRIFYRDRCKDCRECKPIRVPVETFRPSRSQRRVNRRNADLWVSAGRPSCTLAKWSLFCAYLEHQHDGRMIREFEDFRAFLYDSPVETIEFNYFAGDTLIAVSIADLCSRSLSSVYVFFSPEHADRSLGVYSALWEIEFCRRRQVPYYYLGLYVREAPTMSYKDRFRPCEIKDRDGPWQPADASSAVESV